MLVSQIWASAFCAGRRGPHGRPWGYRIRSLDDSGGLLHLWRHAGVCVFTRVSAHVMYAYVRLCARVLERACEYAGFWVRAYPCGASCVLRVCRARVLCHLGMEHIHVG